MKKIKNKILDRLNLVGKEEYESLLLDYVKCEANECLLKKIIKRQENKLKDLKENNNVYFDIIEEKKRELKALEAELLHVKLNETVLRDNNKNLSTKLGETTKEFNRCKLEYKHAISIIFKESKLDPDTRNYLSIRKNKIIKEFNEKRVQNEK